MTRRIGSRFLLVAAAALSGCVSASSGARDRFETPGAMPALSWELASGGNAATDDGLPGAFEAIRTALLGEPLVLGIRPLDPAIAARFAGENAIVGPLTLPEIRTLALIRNRMTIAAHQQLAADMLTLTQAQALDGVLRSYRSLSEGVMVPVGGQEQRAMPNALFPTPGMTALRGRLVESGIRAARERVRKAARMAQADAEMAAIAAASGAAQIAVLAENRSALEAMEALALARVRGGTGDMADVLRLQAERGALAVRELELSAERDAAGDRLAEILDLPSRPSVAVVWSSPLTLPAVDSLRGAAATRDELAAMDHAIRRMTLMIEMGERQSRPEPGTGDSAGGSAGGRKAEPGGAMPAPGTGTGDGMTGGMDTDSGASSGAASGGMSANGGTMTETMATPWAPVAEAYLNELRVRVTAMRTERAAMALAVRRETDEARVRAVSLGDRVQTITKDLLPPLREARDLAVAAYRGGMGDLERVLDLQRMVLMQEEMLAAMTADREMALVALEAACGIPVR